MPPGPNALPSSPSEITSLPVDGCTLLGNDGGLDIITPGPGPHQHANDHKAIVKSNQNNVHPNASGAQFHSAQLNGVQCNHTPLQNHVQHRASDNQTGPSDHHSGGNGEIQGDHTNKINLTRNKRCSDISQTQSPPNNGINCTESMAITESGFCQLQNDVSSRTGLIDQGQAAMDGGELGPGPQGAGVEQAAPTDSSPVAEMSRLALEEHDESIRYVRYESELQMPDIIRLITKDLSEPYSIYTYRYFIHNWPQLCFLVCIMSFCQSSLC